MRLIDSVIRIAPYAIFCCMFNLAAQFGWDLLFKLAAYVGVVLLALAIQMFGVFPMLLAFLARRNPLTFFRQTREASLMAFSTASSNARSEEHTSELQSLMRISYAVFCLKKKKQHICN